MLYFIKKILKYSIFFIRAKKQWKMPPKNEIVILDDNGSDRIIDLILGHEECTVLKIGAEQLMFQYL